MYIYTENPDVDVGLQPNLTDQDFLNCYFNVDFSGVDKRAKLKNNFKLTFICFNCTGGYQVGLQQYYVNT